ncbi:MAG TPA: hypothetical protein PKK99_13410, partial [Bacteroidia bacterium]|nr:hypothetical protein [Bacteroidia bacterium]
MDFLDLIIPRYTTPLPSFARNLLITSEGMDFMMTSGRTQIRAVIRPDRFDFPPYFDPGSDAETGCEIDTDVYHNVTFDSRSRVLNFDRREFVVHIRTRYKITIDPEIQSSYGRGTTRRDRQAGNTTLRFHESQHGVMCLNYIHRNQIPDLV